MLHRKCVWIVLHGDNFPWTVGRGSFLQGQARGIPPQDELVAFWTEIKLGDLEWTTLPEIVTPSSPTGTYVDNSEPVLSHRFYRVALVQ